MSEQSQEEVIFEGDSAKVTTARAILHGKTYAMSNITSVQSAKQDESPLIPFGVIAFGAILILVSGGILLTDGGLEPLVMLVLGIAAIAGGVALWRRLMPVYIVRIASSSGEADALQSKNKEFIDKVVSAINEAIVRRG